MSTVDTRALKKELHDVFATEADELLERIEQQLVAVEHSANGELPQAMTQIRRHLHTLKGAAGALGVVPIVRICHELEEGLAARLDAGEPLEIEDFDAFHDALHFIRSWLADGETPPFDYVLQTIRRAFSNGSVEDRSPHSPDPDAAQTPPTKANGKATTAPPSPQKNSQTPSLPRRPSTVRIASSKLDDMQAIAGELVVLNLQQEKSQEQMACLRDGLGETLSQWRGFYADLRLALDGLTGTQIRRLQHRASQLGQEIREAYQGSYDLARWSVGHTGRLAMVSNALEDGLRDLRMQPLGPFFDTFAPVLRDAARSEEKKVRFETGGRDIEVDRSVLERLRDPLLHLVRNAVAHGIESPKRRQRIGKPPVGTVAMEASSIGEKVRIDVRDDGAGVDAEAVRQRALEADLLRPNEKLDEGDLLALLTHPGFSTRGEAGRLAGRGIGLDAVEAVVAEFGGSLTLETQPGQGAAFSLVVPTSITTSQGLIVEVGPYRMGIALNAVERILRLELDEMGRVEGKPVVYHDGDPVAAVPLAQLVGAPDLAPARRGKRCPTLILRSGNQRLAALVDDIPGELPMVIKPLGPQFSNVPLFAGGAIQADGSVLPVLEHRELLRVASGIRVRSATLQELAEPAEDQPTQISASPGDEPTTILVVDDSVTTRTLERNILEAAGFRVLTATDGAEALDILRTEEHDGTIDLLVTDVDMPRVNGLELCRAVRQGPRGELPIIVVTSKGGDDEVQQGLEAGADAYIVKGNFEQEHFMATVNRFVH